MATQCKVLPTLDNENWQEEGMDKGEETEQHILTPESIAVDFPSHLCIDHDP